VIILHHGGGAALTELYDPALPGEEWTKLRSAAMRLLAARGGSQAAELLERYPFELLQGTNYFRDEFAVLHATVSLDQYVELGEMHAQASLAVTFGLIAETISEIGPFTRFVAASLDTEEKVIPVAAPSPKITSESVERALADAQHLIQARGASSAVDRVHTALHGYLRAALQREGIPFADDASITKLFKMLKERHPAFQDLGRFSEEALKMTRSMSSIVDSLSTLRNQASGAHPNKEVLRDAEAMLAINATRTLLHYLDRKLND
jgi:hypothetical protein